MSFQERLKRNLTDFLVERPGRNRSYADWVAALEESGQSILARAQRGKNPIVASKVLRHISGIERWGQSRMRVFLGAPFVQDEYDGYKPAPTLTAEEQSAFFRQTRAETIALTQQLAAAKIPETATVAHNQFGPLTARGWLSYLNGHARREVYRIR